MTQSRSFTSATPSVSYGPAGDPANGARRALPAIDARVWWRVVWVGILLLGLLLRLQRLPWQPLWWDEGYSIYFATEPLAEMLRLTALDIHPPLYYALLHGWFYLMGDTGPVTARLFSVVVGVVTLPTMTWAARTLWPRQPWLALAATLLLAISPIHLFYSQEVRMYGLALWLTLVASTCLWRLQHALERDQRPYFTLAGYVVAASLALLTVYYAGFLLLAHQVWAIARNRRQFARLRWPLAAALLILLIQLPWWFYALPKLFVYVGDKVLADQDVSLPLWRYLWYHWLAYLSGHLGADPPWVEGLRLLSAGLIGVIILAISLLGRRQQTSPALRYAAMLLIVPVAVGYIVNLVYPFFPDGGERLLLYLLPYLLLVVTALVMRTLDRHPYQAAALVFCALAGSVAGLWIYFTTPRYVEHDYRPIIADVYQQSRDHDTVLALFPWQVGYWRAYSPRTDDGTWLTPQPAAVGQTVLEWDEDFAATLDAELARGTLWFPMPLSFGSTLPGQVEEYLRSTARNLENRWYSDATRLTAWVRLDTPQQSLDVNAAYAEGVTLQSVGIGPTAVESANQPVALDLCWQPATVRSDLRATLRLMDANAHTWASRDLPEIAAYTGTSEDPCLEQVAFNIPVGLPPQSYTLAIGVGPENSDLMLTPAGATAPLISISEINVTVPAQAPSPYRLPIAHPLHPPLAAHGLIIHGYTGPDEDATLLAGDEVALTLYLQNTSPSPSARELQVTLLDRRGDTVVSWQAWPLPEYPTATWSQGAVGQVPLQFYLPADLAAAEYRLATSFVDVATEELATEDASSDWATLATVQVERRPASFALPSLENTLTPSATFGTHATLVGYVVRPQNHALEVELTWQVTQPLLPPHHIFVHLLDAEGTQLSQQDGEAVTAHGRAPTGSWLPGEYLTTHHEVPIPSDGSPPDALRVGLYLPRTEARLPVTVEGEVIGDSVTLPLDSRP